MSCARPRRPASCVTSPGSDPRSRPSSRPNSPATRSPSRVRGWCSTAPGSSCTRSRPRSTGSRREIARRFCDSCRQLAVVCSTPDPEPLLDRFAELPQIVAIVERGERRAVGVTMDGAPVELVAAEPDAFGTELLRATGSPAYVRALEPLPVGGRRGGRVRGARAAVVPARAARGAVSRRAAATARRRRHSRRPAQPHHLVGRQDERRGDGPRRRRARLSSTWRSATTRRPSARFADSPPMTSAVRARRSRPPTPFWRRFASCAGSSATSCPTGGSICPTRSSPSSNGCRPASTADSGCRRPR